MLCCLCKQEYDATEAESTYTSHFTIGFEAIYSDIERMPPYLHTWEGYCAECAITEAKRERSELLDYSLYPDEED